MLKEKRKVYVSTFGCQMNERDSENMVGLLAKHDFVQTAHAEEADLILVNTCSIRELASQKAASELGRYGKMKERTQGKKPLIGVTGCLAQQEGGQFLKRFPFVDLVLGTDAIPRLPEWVQKLETSRKKGTGQRLTDIERDLDAPAFMHEYLPYPVTRPDANASTRRVSAYIIITKGCDFRCTFCVVPHTRGPERSASPEEIVQEARMLAGQGVREVTFLGQNVNSYGKNFSPPVSFTSLLRRVESEIPANGPLQRLRFTTSHPLDLSDELMEAFQELPRLCHHLHLPVQSGDNQVLRRMKRLYTIEEYRGKIKRLRSLIPSISLSTDIIVGFPGETAHQFDRTLALLREVRYTQIYAFKYSERPNTPASRLTDDIPEAEKNERLSRLLEVQRQISREDNESLVGKRLKVLVEGKNRKPGVLNYTGRAECHRLVHFLTNGNDEGDLTGQFVETTIEAAQDNSLVGRMISGTAH